MKLSKRKSWVICAALVLAMTFASPAQLPAQTAKPTSSGTDIGSRQWSVQVERVNATGLDLAPSFQVAIYENLLEELSKTRRFDQVIREGDRKAFENPNLLTLKTMVLKYVPGSETRRAVTTVSGATKLSVRIQLSSREGEIVFERTVNGNVRFFGSNLRVTHNLAHNIVKVINKSSWSIPDQPTATLTGRLSTHCLVFGEHRRPT